MDPIMLDEIGDRVEQAALRSNKSITVPKESIQDIDIGDFIKVDIGGNLSALKPAVKTLYASGYSNTRCVVKLSDDQYAQLYIDGYILKMNLLEFKDGEWIVVPTNFESDWRYYQGGRSGASEDLTSLDACLNLADGSIWARTLIGIVESEIYTPYNIIYRITLNGEGAEHTRLVRGLTKPSVPGTDNKTSQVYYHLYTGGILSDKNGNVFMDQCVCATAKATGLSSPIGYIFGVNVLYYNGGIVAVTDQYSAKKTYGAYNTIQHSFKIFKTPNDKMLFIYQCRTQSASIEQGIWRFVSTGAGQINYAQISGSITTGYFRMFCAPVALDDENIIYIERTTETNIVKTDNLIWLSIDHDKKEAQISGSYLINTPLPGNTSPWRSPTGSNAALLMDGEYCIADSSTHPLANQSALILLRFSLDPSNKSFAYLGVNYYADIPALYHSSKYLKIDGNLLNGAVCGTYDLLTADPSNFLAYTDKILGVLTNEEGIIGTEGTFKTNTPEILNSLSSNVGCGLYDDNIYLGSPTTREVKA